MKFDVPETFKADVKDHVMTVELDQGLHRSLLFSRRDSGICHFRLTTWHNHLAITGDMGDFVFCRLKDMFQFFRGKPISEGYYAEKCVAGIYEEFNPDTWPALLEHLLECESITKETQEALLDESHGSPEDAYQSLDLYDLCDASEDVRSMYTYTTHFLWCLYAIKWGIERYDASKGDTP